MEFLINPDKTKHAASEMESCIKTIRTAWYNVGSVRKTCAIQGRSRAAVVNSLDNIMEEIHIQEKKVSKMSDTLKEISSLYEKTEKNVISDLSSDKPASGGGKKSSGKTTEEKEDKKKVEWKWSDTFKIVSQFGPLGAVIGTVGGIYNGTDGTGKKVVGTLDGLSSVIGGVADVVIAAKDTKTDWWNNIVGLDGVEGTTNVGENFIKHWNKQFVDDLGFNGADTVADKVKVGAKWAGHVLTLAGNAVENYQEAREDGISAGRAVTETVVETGVDIALGAAATAGASAVLTAASTALFGVAAPAVVVGAAAVGVTWAANQACESIFGKDIGEVAADVVCDTGEAIESGVKNVGKAIGKGIANVADGVGNAFKSAGNSLKNISSKWSKSIFAFA